MTADTLPVQWRDNIIAEPVARNTLGAVLLAVALVHAKDPDGRLAILPADHIIPDVALFQDTLRAAFELTDDYVVTLGVVPSYPETGYGYIKAGGPLPSTGIQGLADAALVERFVEKPDEATATRFLAEGGYYWNAGMFVLRTSTFLETLLAREPYYAEVVTRAAELFRTGSADAEHLRPLFDPLPNKNIDKAVMEQCGNMAVIPAGFRWSDVGSWDSAWEHRPEGESNFVKGSVLLDECEGSVVVNAAGEPMVAVSGLTDVVIIVTDDAVLVTRRGRGQRVAEIVNKLKESGRDDLL